MNFPFSRHTLPHANNITYSVQITRCPLCNLNHVILTLFYQIEIFFSVRCSQAPCSSFKEREKDEVSHPYKQVTNLYTSNFGYLDKKPQYNFNELYSTKYFQNLICSSFHHGLNFQLSASSVSFLLQRGIKFLNHMKQSAREVAEV